MNLSATYRLHEGGVVSGRGLLWRRVVGTGGCNNSRLGGRLEVVCEPNGGIGAESKLVDHPVPLTIDIPKVYGMVSSRLISMRTLHVWAREVKVKGCEGLH